ASMTAPESGVAPPLSSSSSLSTNSIVHAARVAAASVTSAMARNRRRRERVDAMVSLQSSGPPRRKHEDRFSFHPGSDDQPFVRAPRLLALGLLAHAAGAAPAQAGVVVGEGVPFTAEELADAIEARSGEPVGDVQVERSPGADVRVITPDGTWDVAVGEAHGPVAA